VTRSNGTDPAPRTDRVEKGEGNLSAETVARLQRRTEDFQKATQRKGLLVTWGVGKESLKPKRKRATRRNPA
jgi:competence CoiA-like predicted nuclease